MSKYQGHTTEVKVEYNELETPDKQYGELSVNNDAAKATRCAAEKRNEEELRSKGEKD